MRSIIPALVILLVAFNPTVKNTTTSDIQKKVDEFKTVKLTTDLSVLTEKQKAMLPLLIEAAGIMDGLFWKQAFGDKEALLGSDLTDAEKAFVKINYGPWERLNGNKPFLDNFGAKPPGAQFYPEDMTKEEFASLDNPDKSGLYTLIRRNEDRSLVVVPYSEAYHNELTKAAGLLRQAAELAENDELKRYLLLRADALTTDDYYESDLAWMDMKTNTIDVVIGAIETYEDALFGYKAAYEGYVLVKDKDWSERLSKYASLLPELQKQLPVPDAYKAEEPGTDSELNAYDVIYYAGDCNAGSKTIAINLPNDERVQELKGSRRLQLKNAMKAKFDQILVPIANEIIVEDQVQHIQFDAFFQNTMFHEVAHGLGIKNTLDGTSTVRKAMKDKASSLEEGKADILGLFLVTKLNEMNEIDVDLMDNYVTFMAGIFRSIRFGAASAHGVANLIRFNYFKDQGAFTQSSNGKYGVDFDKMQEAMNSLSNIILTIQGDGDYNAAVKLIEKYGKIDPELQKTLDRIDSANIPVDIVFEQGTKVLGL